MIRATIDTNVLASGFISGREAPGQLLAAWEAERFVLVISEAILIELDRTLREDYFAARSNPARRNRFLALLRRRAEQLPYVPVISRVATRSEDDVILATAAAGRVQYLVTGDRQLLRLERYREVEIVSPRAFLSLLLTDQP